MDRSLRVATIGGIPLAIHLSWPLVFAVVTWSLAESYLPARLPDTPHAWLWGIAAGASALLFLSVLLHEYAHAFAARRCGLGVDGIDLFLFGGVARLAEEPDRPGAEFIMAAAGPACSLALAGLGAGAFVLLTPSIGGPIGAAPLVLVLDYFVLVNVALGVFNLVPGFPLDGGRMLRALLWRLRHDRRQATGIAAALGQVVGFGLVLWGSARGALGFVSTDNGLGAAVGGVWLVLTGWFLIEAARSAYQATVEREATARLRLADLELEGEVPPVPADSSIETLVRDYILAREHLHYPVVDGNAIVGTVGVEQVRSVPRERWAETPVRSLLAPLSAGQVAWPGDRAAEVLGRMARDGVNRLLIVDRGRVVGVLSRHQLSAALGRE